MPRRAGVLLFALIAVGVGVYSFAPQSLALPMYGDVPAFELKDERGATLRRQDLLGKVTVVDFVFTSCSAACPLLTERMGKLQADVTRFPMVQLLSISVDPERDTEERLRAYAQKNGANPASWHFLRGDDKVLQRVVVDGMKQDITRQVDKTEADGFSLLHGTRFVLVDQTGQIRGFYDANDAPSMLALRAAISALARGRVTVAP